MMKSGSASCATCGGELSGRQRRFCSRMCKNRDTNHRHQSYVSQQTRGLERKKYLLALSNSQCSNCGYSKNLAALVWHHIDPDEKKFSLDLRSLSNRRIDELHTELKKCIVLCANCHAETHFPHLSTVF
jgi:hypothetical protein